MSKDRTITLEHPTGCKVVVLLPADMETVGRTLEVLGKEGYTIPDASGRTRAVMTVGLQKIEV